MLPGISEGADEKNKQQANLAMPPVREPGPKDQGRRAQVSSKKNIAMAILQGSSINEPGLKIRPINWFREQGTGFKAQAIGRKILGPSPRVHGDSPPDEGGSHDK